MPTYHAICRIVVELLSFHNCATRLNVSFYTAGKFFFRSFEGGVWEVKLLDIKIYYKFVSNIILLILIP